ncbi:unnamed protein product [Lactuca saligna]|uniref:Protein EARLY FLOWERING 3 n=1 Tax=Lactuca saligna TaxID=75948 RepID=A0AA35YJC2_LACSI|nr:unnamed protein product [Lactuca saligna]
MKRGVDENNKGPMFPRLHVNDTEKGGPRAPPRNKMALYEQLTIPSQRLSGGELFPFKPTSTVNYPLPPSSSSQGEMSGRGSFFPLYQTPLPHVADKINMNRYSDSNNQLVQREQKKKQEDDDFRVPIFVQQSGINPDCNGNHQNKNNEGLSPSSSAFSCRFTNIQRNNSQDLPKAALNQSSKPIQLKEANGSSSFDHKNALNNSIRLQRNGNSREADNNNSVLIETIRTVGYGNSLLPIRDVQQEVLRIPNDLINGDVVSETSMVDYVSGVDISPDDVVGVIGQKHFWKARRAIVNQQRLFVVQLFELHRLIKVQKLIAGLPQPMVEDEAFIGKPQKVSPIPVDFVLKSSTHIIPNIKDYHENPKEDTREFSAENDFEKTHIQTSLSFVQNNSGPRAMFSGYQSLPPSDPRMCPWGLTHQHHPPGHQWLIPVMSPSEGLIYKPYYPGAPPPMFGQNMVNHGVPQQPHYQWPTGFVPPPAHGYFPPYGMTEINTFGYGGEDMNMNHPQTRYKSVDACNNNSEVQVSNASSFSSDRLEKPYVLPFFLMCSPTVEGEGSRVIRVVPRNAQLANESVARIFQSIQDERKR